MWRDADNPGQCMRLLMVMNIGEFDNNGLMRIRDMIANDYLSKNQNVAIALIF